MHHTLQSAELTVSEMPIWGWYRECQAEWLAIMHSDCNWAWFYSTSPQALALGGETLAGYASQRRRYTRYCRAGQYGRPVFLSRSLAYAGAGP
jgi:hypothetical protein